MNDNERSFVGREIIPRIVLWHVHREYKILDKASDIIVKILKEDLEEMSKLHVIPPNRNERAKDIIMLRRCIPIATKHQEKVNGYFRKWPYHLRYYKETTDELTEIYNKWISRIKYALRSEGVEVDD